MIRFTTAVASIYILLTVYAWGTGNIFLAIIMTAGSIFQIVVLTLRIMADKWKVKLTDKKDLFTY